MGNPGGRGVPDGDLQGAVRIEEFPGGSPGDTAFGQLAKVWRWKEAGGVHSPQFAEFAGSFGEGRAALPTSRGRARRGDSSRSGSRQLGSRPRADSGCSWLGSAGCRLGGSRQSARRRAWRGSSC